MSGPEVQHPIIPEAQDFFNEVNNRLDDDPEYRLTPYGHAAGNLMTILYANSFIEDPEESIRFQRERMISKARKLLKEFGPNIISHLREDLKLVIDEEKLLESEES